MKRWLEITVFLTLAAALHLAAFAGQPKSGVTAGGSGGDAMVSLKAAAPTVTAMVQSWESAPVVQAMLTPRIKAPRVPPISAPALPNLQIEQSPHGQLTVAPARPQIEEEVQIDTTPPPAPEPEVHSNPKVTPKQRLREKPEQHRRKSEVTSEAVAKQVSTGAGRGSQAGTGTANVTTATGATGKEAQLQAVWGAKIRARIERNKRYPRGSKSSGDVIIHLTISRDGRLVSHKLTKSSGDPTLDQAAIGAVARTKRLPKAPKELAGNSFRFSLSIRMKPR